MRRFVTKAIEKTDKLSKEQLQRIIAQLSEEIEALTDENDEFASIFESLSSGLLILDTNFCLEQNNSAAEGFLNFSIQSDDSLLYGMPVWDVIGEEEIAEFLKNASKKKITNATEEFTTQTEGGTVRFLLITLSPLYKNNNLSGNIVIVKDITDRKNGEVLLHRMESLASLTNLAAGIAHEIKNPLGAISIHIQLVQKALEKARENADTLPAKKFVEDHIDVVNEEIDHLNSLVMDFLFAVRPVNAKLELKNPEKIILNMKEFFKPEFTKCSVDFQTDLKFPDTKLLIDEKLFRELLVNMIQNSLYAIQTKSPKTGILNISSEISDGKYILSISDNGCGMDEETISKIFEPYYTTKANGTGLGMTMVYKVMKEFSGEIKLQSEKGEGTVFTLFFPLPQSEKKLLR